MHPFSLSLVDKYQKAFSTIFFSPENALVLVTLRDIWRFYVNHPLGVRFECGSKINAACENN